MNINAIMTPQPVTIEDIIYIMDKFGVVSPSIKVEPPLQVPMFNNTIIEQLLIHLNPFLEPGYDNIFKGSIVDIFKTPDARFVLEVRDNSNIDVNVPLFPRTCPSCGNELRVCNGQYICNNITCPTQVLERCTHFIRSIHMHLHGIYYQIFCILISRGHIRNLVDIFTVPETAIASIENVNDKQIKLFKLLTLDKIGKVSMTEFLHGLCIISGVYDDIDIIRDFVIYQNNNAQRINRVFDITGFIQLVEEAIRYFNIYISPESNNALLSIFDQIQKLPQDKIAELRNTFGILDLYSISGIIDYVINPINKAMLNAFVELKLIGCNN